MWIDNGAELRAPAWRLLWGKDQHGPPLAQVRWQEPRWQRSLVQPNWAGRITGEWLKKRQWLVGPISNTRGQWKGKHRQLRRNEPQWTSSTTWLRWPSFQGGALSFFWAWGGDMGIINWRAPSPSCYCSQRLFGVVCGNSHHIAFARGSHMDTTYGQRLPSSFSSSLVVNTFLWMKCPLFFINIVVIVPILFHWFVFSENYFLSRYPLLLSLPYQKGWEEGE